MCIRDRSGSMSHDMAGMPRRWASSLAWTSGLARALTLQTGVFFLWKVSQCSWGSSTSSATGA
eukprot:843488-Alexandrium_andersonii.AAC.1